MYNISPNFDGSRRACSHRLCRWSTRHGDLQWSSNCITPIFLSFLKGQFSNDSLYSYQKKTLFVRLAMQSPICFSGLVQVCYSQILIYPLPNIIRWGCNHPNWGLAGEVPGMKTFTVWEALWTYRASTHHLHPSSVSSEEALDSALWVQECRKQRSKTIYSWFTPYDYHFIGI